MQTLLMWSKVETAVTCNPPNYKPQAGQKTLKHTQLWCIHILMATLRWLLQYMANCCHQNPVVPFCTTPHTVVYVKVSNNKSSLSAVPPHLVLSVVVPTRTIKQNKEKMASYSYNFYMHHTKILLLNTTVSCCSRKKDNFFLFFIKSK